MSGRRELITRILQTTGIERLLKSRDLWQGLVVLNYHRIGNRDETLLDRGLFSSTQEQFDRHIRMVRDHAEIIDPKDVQQVLSTTGQRNKYVLFTFDDGYRDNFDLAFPVLQANDAKASFFLTTGFLDNPRLPWYDELAWIIRTSSESSIRIAETEYSLAGDRQPAIAAAQSAYVAIREDVTRTATYMNEVARLAGTGRAPAHLHEELWLTWDMVRTMHDAGMEIGAHSDRHPVMADLPGDAQHAEIVRSRDRIHQELGVAPIAFAYPFGGAHQFNETTQAMLVTEGFTRAYSFYGGYNTPGHGDRFDIRRLYVSPETSDAAIRGLVTLPQIYGMVPPRLRR